MNGDLVLLTLRNVAFLAGPVLLAVAVATPVLAWLCRRFGVVLPGTGLLLVIAFGILGGIAGVIAGSTDEAVVGALTTGMLGLVSGLLSYAATKEGTGALRAAFPPIIIALLVNLLVGLAVGQTWRRKWDAYRIELADYRQNYDNIWVPVTRQIQLDIFKSCVETYKSYEQIRRNCTHTRMFPQDTAP